MLSITNLINGAVLNKSNGEETKTSLRINIEGISDIVGQVLVNGQIAERNNILFSASIELTRQYNEIVVQTKNIYGKFQQSIKILWDKNAFKRYNFFVDDNIFFLTDIFKNKQVSLFDHFYLKKLKQFNKIYGTKFTLNLFYRNDHNFFLLKDFPDKYKLEWQNNSDWLKLSFHAYSEFPDRPYQNAHPEKLGADYDIVKSEIIRFAGEETFQIPIVIHWAMVHPDCFKILKERGVKILSGQFINAKTYVGEVDRTAQVADIGYYLDKDKALYLINNQVVHDFDYDLLFIKGDITCNLFTKDEIIRKLDYKVNKSNYNETIGLATHEQYSFDYYENYIPDHFERMETAIRYVTEHGYKPVFFNEGFLGNISWA